MKVVLAVVIFFVIWRWSCASPLPCGNCSKHGDDLEEHDCMQPEVVLKRNVLTSLFGNIKNTTNYVGKKLHIIHKRAADPDGKNQIVVLEKMSLNKTEENAFNETVPSNRSLETSSNKTEENALNETIPSNRSLKTSSNKTEENALNETIPSNRSLETSSNKTEENASNETIRLNRSLKKSSNKTEANLAISSYTKTNQSKESDSRYLLVHDVPPCRKKRQLEEYEQPEEYGKSSPKKGNRNITIIIQNLKEFTRVKREKNKTSSNYHRHHQIEPKKNKPLGRKLLSTADGPLPPKDHVRCACGMLLDNLDLTTTIPIFSECFLEYHPDNTAVDRELMCFHICYEASKLYFVLKQMVLCTHLDDTHLQFQGHFPQEYSETETIFCQVIPRDEELTLPYMISLLKVFLLDVTVCLTGLGVLCVYLICIAKKRKQLVPIYTSPRASTK